MHRNVNSAPCFLPNFPPFRYFLDPGFRCFTALQGQNSATFLLFLVSCFACLLDLAAVRQLHSQLLTILQCSCLLVSDCSAPDRKTSLCSATGRLTQHKNPCRFHPSRGALAVLTPELKQPTGVILTVGALIELEQSRELTSHPLQEVSGQNSGDLITRSSWNTNGRPARCSHVLLWLLLTALLLERGGFVAPAVHVLVIRRLASP